MVEGLFRVKKIVFIIGCVICSDKDNISGESILVILEGGV